MLYLPRLSPRYFLLPLPPREPLILLFDTNNIPSCFVPLRTAASERGRGGDKRKKKMTAVIGAGAERTEGWCERSEYGPVVKRSDCLAALLGLKFQGG